MKINYYPETDSLYIDLSWASSAESREVSEGVVLDYDTEGEPCWHDIDNASKKLEFEQLSLTHVPVGGPQDRGTGSPG